jgi:hypothetical protein
MSISTPSTGGNRRPTTNQRATAGARPTPRNRPKPGSGGRGGSPGGQRGGSGGRRPPITPVKVTQRRNWGPILLFSAVGLIAILIIAFGAYEVHQSGRTWQQKADSISGIVDYRKTDPSMLTRNHKYGVITYKVNPPVGGDHNPNWQSCAPGQNVYTAQIASEHAVHSLEHGAVWITYNPSLPANQVTTLANKVKGQDFMLMSPYPGLDAPISLQAWGFQLKVQNASDGRIDQFIKDLRINAAMEPNTPCSSGNIITQTGPTAALNNLNAPTAPATP